MSIDAGTVAAYLTLDTGKYTSSLQTAKLQMVSFVDDTKSANERVNAFGSGLSTIGTTLIKGVTLPLVGAGTAITMVSANFESAMSEVKAISGAVGQDFDALRGKARELGESTKFSATEAANGMSNLASAGFQVNEIISAMPGLLDLAVSGNIDLASASDIAASTLRGFNLDAAETAHVADVLARAAADTNAGIADTGDAMKYVAPVAIAMGHSLESVTAAVGLLSNAGIKGGQAGTVLRSALARLASPSKEAADIMGELSFNAYDVSGKMLSLSGIIGSLESSMVGLTEQEQQNAITTIFGQEAMSGMLALMQAGSEEIDRLTASFENCDGAATEMAEIMSNNLQGQITELKSKFEGISITLGETLLPVVSDIVGGIKTAADAFAELNPGTQEFIVKAGLAAAAAGPLLTVGGKLTKNITGLISTGKELLSGQSVLAKSTTTLSQAQTAEANALLKLAKAQEAEIKTSATGVTLKQSEIAAAVKLAQAQTQEAAANVKLAEAHQQRLTSLSQSTVVAEREAILSVKNATAKTEEARLELAVAKAQDTHRAATAQLTVAKNELAIATTNVKVAEAEWDDVLSGLKNGDYVKGFYAITEAKNAEALASAKVTVMEREEAGASLKVTAAKTAQTTVTNANTGANWLNVASIKALTAAALANPIFVGMATITAIKGIISAVDYLTSGYERQVEKVKELTEEYQKLEAETSSIETELKNVSTRIDELNEKSSLEIIEQQELKELENINNQLTVQLELKRQLADIAKKEADIETIEALNTKAKDKGVTLTEWIQNAVKSYEYYKQTIAALEAEQARLIAEGDKSSKKFQENARSIELNNEKLQILHEGILESSQDLLEYRKNLLGITEESKEWIVTVDDATVKVHEHMAAYDAEENAKKAAASVRGFNDNIGNSNNILPETTQKILLTTEALKELFDQYESGSLKGKEYVNALKEQIAANKELAKQYPELAARYNTVADILEQLLVRTPEYMDQLTESMSNLMIKSEKLTDVIKEQAEHGKLSNNTVMDMISNGYALALQINKETGAVTLNTDMYMKLTQAKIQEQIVTLESAKQTVLITRMELEKEAADAAAQSIYSLTLAKRAEAESSVDNVTDIEAQIAILNNLMNNLGSVTNSYKSASKGASQKEENTALKEAIKDLENRIELENLTTVEIIKNYEEIKKAYAKSKDEITDLDKKIKKHKEQQYQDELELVEHQCKMDIIRLDEKIHRQAEIHVKYKDMIKDEAKLELEQYNQQKKLSSERLADIDKVVQKTKDIYTGSFDYSEEIASLEELLEIYSKYPAIQETINDKLEESRKNLANQTVRIKQDNVNYAIEAIRYEIELRGQMDGIVLQNGEIYRYTAENKIADTYSIIEANKEMINHLQSLGEVMTEDQARMLKEQLNQQKGYYKEITTLAVQAAKDYQALEEELTQTHKKQLIDREKSDSDYNKAVITANKKKNDDRLKADEDYAKKVQDINQKLVDNEKKLTDTYDNEFNQRVKGFTNFVGIFNEVSKKDISGQQLLDNLKDQLETMEDFRKNLAELADKGIDENLFKELQDMGPGAAAEIAALNSLTEDELDEYVRIYREKSKLANEEVFTQMEAQRKELQASLEQMRRDTSSELSLLNQEYYIRLEEINATAETELNTLAKTWEEKLTEINKDATEKVAELTAKMQEASQALQLGASLETDDSAAKILSSAAKLVSDKVIIWENENKEYSGLQVEQTTINALEIEKQLNNIEESNKPKRASYVRDMENQGKQENQKTENTKRELRVQEREILSSQERNIVTLWSFVPKWREVGVSYGDALLQGIQETRDQIQSYLDDVAETVRAARAGGYSSIGAYASGTRSAAAGLALVGEYGMPEIVDFSGGEQVVNFQESIAMMSRAASVAEEYSDTLVRGFSSNINNRDYEEIDYDKLANKIAGLINNNGKPSIDYHPTYISPEKTSISEQRRQDRIDMQRLGLNLR